MTTMSVAGVSLASTASADPSPSPLLAQAKSGGGLPEQPVTFHVWCQALDRRLLEAHTHLRQLEAMGVRPKDRSAGACRDARAELVEFACYFAEAMRHGKVVLTHSEEIVMLPVVAQYFCNRLSVIAPVAGLKLREIIDAHRAGTLAPDPHPTTDLTA